ncbi:MAG TPA: hypothetical protein VMT05_09320 [Terriglobales bacterium]|jgi:hypothetical protein|nr:hypothetical protein [Terriglobales bacterium]
MRTAFLSLLVLLLVCLAPFAALGQECTQKPPEPQAPWEQSASQSEAEPAPQAQWLQPAPKPGHPLDPNDVAILTGHPVGGYARSPYPNTTVYAYMDPYSYGYSNRSWFGSGWRFGRNGFFFSRWGRFGSPFGRFSFSGVAAGPH